MRLGSGQVLSNPDKIPWIRVFILQKHLHARSLTTFNGTTHVNSGHGTDTSVCQTVRQLTKRSPTERRADTQDAVVPHSASQQPLSSKYINRYTSLFQFAPSKVIPITGGVLLPPDNGHHTESQALHLHSMVPS